MGSVTSLAVCLQVIVRIALLLLLVTVRAGFLGSAWSRLMHIVTVRAVLMPFGCRVCLGTVAGLAGCTGGTAVGTVTSRARFMGLIRGLIFLVAVAARLGESVGMMGEPLVTISAGAVTAVLTRLAMLLFVAVSAELWLPRAA